jgi:hypothetical protein
VNDSTAGAGAVPRAAAPLAVTGGSHGLSATYTELRALASTYAAAADRMRGQAALGGRILADADLLASAVLAPRTFAEAEAAVAAATAGPAGILVDSLGWAADALAIRVAVAALEDADAMVRASLEALDYGLGRATGIGLVGATATAPVWLPSVVGTGTLTAATLAAVLPAPARERVENGLTLAGQEAGAGLHQWVESHPRLVERAFDSTGGLVDGMLAGAGPGLPVELGHGGMLPGADHAGHVLAGLFPDDGPPSVTTRADLAVHDPTPPAALGDVLAHLDAVNRWSGGEASPDNGTIDIQSWTGSDGRRRHIVYLPGTDDLTTLPWTMDSDARDLPANLLVVDGESTTYARGILRAMHEAGIASDEPVLLAGHSQGGIEAAWIAAHTGDFRVAQVVTAGSPLGLMGDYPAGTHVLSLEHRGDVVPLVDGQPNPDRPHQVTITFDDHGSGIVDCHALTHYVAGAYGADLSRHPSVTDQIDALHRLGFLTGEGRGLSSHAFQIARVP